MTQQQIAFLKKVIPAAQACEKSSGIPACVTIAQAIFESATGAGWGTSVLFTKANNPFGIQVSQTSKAAGYGEYEIESWEVEGGQRVNKMEDFVSYPTLQAAFDDHARLLRTPHYAPAYNLLPDWRGFAAALGPKESPTDTQHCTYSTNPKYGASLIGAVNSYHLDDAAQLAVYMEQPA